MKLRLGLLLLLVLLSSCSYFYTEGNNMTETEKNLICEESCQSQGYETGYWLYDDHCGCHNNRMNITFNISE